MTDKELIITLRSMESRSKRAVLNAAADRLEELVAYKETGMELCETNEKYATIMAFNKLRLKVSLTRLCEILQAETEGRCVVLPATTVFELTWDAGPECDMICPVSIDGEGQCDFCDHGQMFVYERKCTQELAEQIGKNVFLTREESVASLNEKER